MILSGYHTHVERRADNRDFYQHCLDNPDYGALICVTERNAKEQIEMLDRFPPEQPLERLIGHKVEVYALRNPVWRKKGRLFIPVGELEELLVVDLGEELLGQMKGNSVVEEVVEENAKFELPDGSVIYGTRKKKVPVSDSAITEVEKYLNIGFDMVFASYKATIKRDVMIAGPLEYHLTKYVLFNGENVEEQKKVARASFAANRQGNRGKFKSILYSAN